MTRDTILVVDDDSQVRALCVQALASEGYEVACARDGQEALLRARETSPSLAIIDVLMPGMSGIELCQSLRARGLAGLPILFLTAKRDIADKAAGFAVGADDYLTKPFDIRELLMRVRALLRRTAPTRSQFEPREVIVGDLRLDRSRRTLATKQKAVQLTPVEHDLMCYLMMHPGEWHSSQKLLREVWGYADTMGDSDLVRQHVKNIRDKIEPDPSQPRYIRNVRSHGYMVVEA
ncbi:MAG: response regulator transcription factor [Chloroflexi bacterium]|nr:response regulator transcription factor [Chloroflexota bacterium]